MFRTFFTAATLLCLCLSLNGADSVSDAAELAGTWRYQGDARVATYFLSADGTFSAELSEGTSVAKFKGKWKLADGTIEYSYYEGTTKSVVDRDKLLRVDETSFTIQVADGNQRTYWRVKE